MGADAFVPDRAAERALKLSNDDPILSPLAADGQKSKTHFLASHAAKATSSQLHCA
jgi:hypothetical protein